MPELPEVETTLRGLLPALTGQRIVSIVVRERRLRYPFTVASEQALTGQRIVSLARRAKYLLLELEHGAGLWHLGMSGRIHLVTADTPAQRHDHFDLILTNDRVVRFHDPRRFGFLQWIPAPAEQHRLLAHLGVEPLTAGFDGAYLHQRTSGRRTCIKTFVMNQRVVVGVGNIYASEALHLAGIHPAQPASEVSRADCDRLALHIRAVLTAAIAQGGTTMRDFQRADGQPGYFAQSLRVYQRTSQPCNTCGSVIEQQRIGQRASFFCPRCQPLPFE